MSLEPCESILGDEDFTWYDIWDIADWLRLSQLDLCGENSKDPWEVCLHLWPCSASLLVFHTSHSWPDLTVRQAASSFPPFPRSRGENKGSGICEGLKRKERQVFWGPCLGSRRNKSSAGDAHSVEPLVFISIPGGFRPSQT